MITDSGGVQEETSYLGVPCFTVRDNTERPVTVTSGTNTLLGLDARALLRIPELLELRSAHAARDSRLGRPRFRTAGGHSQRRIRSAGSQGRPLAVAAP